MVKTNICLLTAWT